MTRILVAVCSLDPVHLSSLGLHFRGLTDLGFQQRLLSCEHSQSQSSLHDIGTNHDNTPRDQNTGSRRTSLSLPHREAQPSHPERKHTPCCQHSNLFEAQNICHYAQRSDCFAHVRSCSNAANKELVPVRIIEHSRSYSGSLASHQPLEPYRSSAELLP